MRLLRRASLLAVLGLALAALGAPAAAAKPPPGHTSFWVELGPKRDVIARAVTKYERCPRVVVDGERLDMTERAAPTAAYPVRTCELALPPRVERAKLKGKRLPLPGGPPERIAVIGDTGCRLLDGVPPQSCNDPAEWPFAAVAEAVAEWEPDLVVHVGDYHYREDPCPEGDAGCAGSPSGFNWPTWQADFFRPARKALRAAPWVVMRGNHESCSRAGAGWFMFLDPRPMPAECVNVTAPYPIRAGGGLRLVVMDSANAADSSPTNPDPYVPQFAALPRLGGKEGWLLTHRPIWALASFRGAFVNTNLTLQEASGNRLPDNIEAVISGHLHQAEVLAFGPDRQPQIVVGQGGTELDPPLPPGAADGAEVGEMPMQSGDFLWEFGFNGFIRDGDGWRFDIRDTEGRVLRECALVRTSPCG